MIENLKKENPDAKVIAHPECREEVLRISDYITGTGGMANFAKLDKSENFIIATECGMAEKLRLDVPDKNFLSFCNICPYMKMTTLPLALESLKQNKHEIKLPNNITAKARKALDRMLEFS